MNLRTLDLEKQEFGGAAVESRWIDRLARRIVLGRLASLRDGEIRLRENGEVMVFGRANGAFPVRVEIDVNSAAFYSDIAFGGSIGAGEAYIRGLWECDRIESLVRILLRNRDVLDGMESGLAAMTPLIWAASSRVSDRLMLSTSRT